jgi:hypothetical protein
LLACPLGRFGDAEQIFGNILRNTARLRRTS